MKNFYINFSVKHPVSILMFILAILLLGLISSISIGIDYLPVLSEKNLLVTTRYEGISANEMQELVTIPVENAFSSLNGLKNISSTTRDGLSQIKVELKWGSDCESSLTEARQIIDLCYEMLPYGCSKPEVKAFNDVQIDSMTIAMIPTDNDLIYARYLLDNEISQRLQRLEGVASISIHGGEKEEILLSVDKALLDSRLLTLEDLSNVISSSNYEYPAGTIEEGNKEFLLKTSGLYTSIEDISNTALTLKDGQHFLIKDIASVSRGAQKKESFYLYNNREAICIIVQKKNTSNPLVLSKNVKAELQSIKDNYVDHYDFVITNDSSIEMKKSIGQLLVTAIISILITFLILYFVFKACKASIIVASLIPLCMLFALFVLKLSGKSLNLFSLTGITVGIGMVIDSSIVVFQNIQHKVLEKPNTLLSENIILAASEVILSSFGSAITTIIVFIPLFFIKGLFGELFSDMAIAVISEIAYSCFLSLTYIPAFVYLLYKEKAHELCHARSFQKIEVKYSKLLKLSFRYKIFSLFFLFICLSGGIILSNFLKKEIIPETSTNTINLEIFFPSAASVNYLHDTAKVLSDRLLQEDSIKNFSISGGIENSSLDMLSDPVKEKERLYISLESSQQTDFTELISRYFENTDIRFSLNKKSGLLSSLFTKDKDLYLVTSDSEEELLEKVKGLVFDSSQILPLNKVNEFVFTPDRQMCSKLNITAAYTAKIIRQYLEGLEGSFYYEKGKKVPVRIACKNVNSDLSTLENINLIINNSNIPVKIAGKFHEEVSEKTLYRVNKKYAKILKGNLKDYPDNLISLSTEEYSQVLHNGVYILIIVILLLYCVMGAQFESFILPVFFMFAIPPSFAGAFFSLFIFRQSLNINSIISLLVLSGTSVNNSIILYEACKENISLTETDIIKKSSSKLCPILVTTFTTIFALLPFSIDPYNLSSQTSMSIAVIGGLLLSTFIVLILVPQILHSYFCQKRK